MLLILLLLLRRLLLLLLMDLSWLLLIILILFILLLAPILVEIRKIRFIIYMNSSNIFYFRSALRIGMIDVYFVRLRGR